jgi:hypothetical protein
MEQVLIHPGKRLATRSLSAWHLEPRGALHQPHANAEIAHRQADRGATTKVDRDPTLPAMWMPLL